MENYESSPSFIEHFVDPNPFDDPSYYHLEVPREKSVRTIANKALKCFGLGKPIVLFAQGKATHKAVNCAEIIKNNYKRPVYQVTRLGEIRTEETWQPVMAELDALKVTRSVPLLYILLSLEEMDENLLGYQKFVKRKENKVVLTVSELQAALEDSLVLSPSCDSPTK